MMRIKFISAVRTVIAAGIAGNHFISEGLLAYLACVLAISVIEIQIFIICTTPRAIAFKGEILAVVNRLDIVSCDDIFRP